MTQNSKIAIVTGAGSGIGKATAMALLHDGWSVVLAGRRQANLEEVVEEAKALNAGSRVLAVPADVTQDTPGSRRAPEPTPHAFCPQRSRSWPKV